MCCVMDRHGVPSKEKQKAGSDYNFVRADRDYRMEKLCLRLYAQAMVVYSCLRFALNDGRCSRTSLRST